MLEMMPYKMRQLISQYIYDKKDGNGPSSANPGLSTAEPKHGQVHPPISPSPELSAHTGHRCK